MVNSRLNMSQQCALAVMQANSTLGCISRGIACLIKGSDRSLPPGTFHTHLKHQAQFWTPPVQERHR